MKKFTIVFILGLIVAAIVAIGAVYGMKAAELKRQDDGFTDYEAPPPGTQKPLPIGPIIVFSIVGIIVLILVIGLIASGNMPSLY
jgi:hypothetical protein